MLGDIEPVATGLDLCSATRSHAVKSSIPEVKVVNRSLLISHVDVEGKEVDWRQSLPAEDLEQGG